MAWGVQLGRIGPYHSGSQVHDYWRTCSQPWQLQRSVRRFYSFYCFAFLDLLIHNRRSQNWPKHITLQPSSEKQVPEQEFQAWIKKYDPVWCQIVPSSKPHANSTLNEIVFRQLVDQLTDQNLVGLFVMVRAAYL